jgi:hypothetical protein
MKESYASSIISFLVILPNKHINVRINTKLVPIATKKGKTIFHPYTKQIPISNTHLSNVNKMRLRTHHHLYYQPPATESLPSGVDTHSIGALQALPAEPNPPPPDLELFE